MLGKIDPIKIKMATIQNVDIFEKHQYKTLSAN